MMIPAPKSRLETCELHHAESYQDGAAANTGWETGRRGDAGLWRAPPRLGDRCCPRILAGGWETPLEVRAVFPAAGPPARGFGLFWGRAPPQTAVLGRTAGFFSLF